MVIKFNPEGRVRDGARPPAGSRRGRRAPRRQARRRRREPYVFSRPTDVGLDAAGNIFVTDGYGNSRVVKFDKNGRFIKEAGTRGSQPGQLNLPHTMAMDAQGQRLRRRSQQRARAGVRQRSELQGDLRQRRRTRGRCASRPVRISICSSRIRFPTTGSRSIADITGEIYKMELDGTIVGKFGKPGKQLKRVQHGARDRLPQSRTSCSSRKSPRGACRRSSCARRRRRPAAIGDCHETLLCFCAIVLAVAGGPLGAQTSMPEIAFDCVGGLPEAAGRSLSRRGRRRRDQLARATCSSTREPATRPSALGNSRAVHARRIAALRVRRERRIRA